MVDDFASGALVAALRRALARDGVPVPAATTRTVLVPLTVKRTLLAGVAAEHGLLTLVRAGAGVLRERSDPMLAALCAAGNPADLFDRWGRLERFTHARHRVAVPEIGVDRLVAEHVGPPGGRPEPAEDAVILGLLTGLMGAVGARGLRVTAGAGVVYADGAFHAPGTDTARWCFTWSSLQRQAPQPAAGTGLAVRARQMLAGDPARHWTLDRLAADLAVSSRGLQRELSGVGGFTGLLAAVRAEAAARLLRAGVHPLSVVGFTCGYADQPHFTREFKRRTAMTPGQYRSAFAPERHP
ncbi:AraC family transcriptional regulator [Actinoplanes sp. NPDC024001]|uniref:helix-turn-helix transcriptional regulator n=1 Tax=Actinoplanes sp. NPDC024001 TaxID=3154598 RepID=UPI003407EA73